MKVITKSCDVCKRGDIVTYMGVADTGIGTTSRYKAKYYNISKLEIELVNIHWFWKYTEKV